MLRNCTNRFRLICQRSGVEKLQDKVRNTRQVSGFHLANGHPFTRQFHADMENSGKRAQSLCIKDYDVVGFDIDHTLAKYNIPNLYNLVHDKFAQRLVDQKGYDASLLEPFDIHRDLCTRGLVADLEKGNFLKIGKGGVILRANHGTKPMSEEEIQSIYGKEKLFKHYEKFLETADNIKKDDDKSIAYFMFDNFYDVIVTVVIARMIDLIDKKEGQKLEVYDIFGDVQAALNSAYHYTNFAAKTGGFFPSFEENTGEYVEKLSTGVKEWLKKLKNEGKVMFIMTSSYVDFASCTMNHIFGEDWREYFDTIITYSRKPSFFHSNNHFRRLEGTSEKEPVTDLKKGEIYSQGNLKTFNKLLTQLSGKDDPKVLYFGDGLRSDIVGAKKFANWDTVFIYEEMEAEVGDKVRQMTDTKEQEEDSDEPVKKKLKRNEDFDNTDKLKKPDSKERQYLSSSRWGSFLVDDIGNSDRQLESTMYGELMRKYTDLAIAQIPYITDLPLDHQFSRINQDELSAEGFYPRPPEIMRNLPAKNSDVKQS